jgi:hypothetical protein
MESRFEALAKALAESGSRREALKRLAGAAAAAALTAVGISCSPDQLVGPGSGSTRPLFGSGGRCKKNDKKCRQDAECCSGLCNSFTGICACSAGMTTCPVSGQCVPACGPLKVLNPDTCLCECPPTTPACGFDCCTADESCCSSLSGGQCCGPDEFCHSLLGCQPV